MSSNLDFVNTMTRLCIKKNPTKSVVQPDQLSFMALQLMLLRLSDILLISLTFYYDVIYTTDIQSPSYNRLLQMAHTGSEKVSESPAEGSAIEKDHSPPPVQEMPEGGVQAWAAVIGA